MARQKGTTGIYLGEKARGGITIGNDITDYDTGIEDHGQENTHALNAISRRSSEAWESLSQKQRREIIEVVSRADSEDDVSGGVSSLLEGYGVSISSAVIYDLIKLVVRSIGGAGGS